ncbi:DUF3052 family protein [Streptosporangium fragile]|uniref:DUF3052 family protein n=1 Tax=Streptosporangium fragile TaxID=46186 RepID=A0ABP6ICB5_9ACTN
MAEYSGTPLPRKLGIKPGHRVLLTGSPGGFELRGVDHHRRPGPEPYDVIVLFCPDQAALHDRFPGAKARLAKNGGLWVCWPKRASRVPTDLGDGVVREYGLARGLVDNKVASIDAVWSGLRFVYRLTDR